MASYKVEEIPCPKLDLGEGPHWDVKTQSLYFVSLFEATIYRLDYQKNKVYHASVEGCKWTSFIIPVKGRNSEFVVADGSRILLISWDGVSDKAKIAKVIADLDDKENRINDGKADSKGRLFTGTLKAEHCGNPFKENSGRFYRFDAKSDEFVEQFDKVFISNGLAWNEKTRKFYYVDSGAYTVQEFDFNEDGDLSNGKVLLDMSVTCDNYLFFRSGQILQKIEIPAKQVTSVAFGGPNLDELFVTTAKRPFVEAQGPLAGATFKVTGLGVRGLPMTDVEL